MYLKSVVLCANCGRGLSKTDKADVYNNIMFMYVA